MSFMPTKRLLKDLPFLDAGNVLVRCNGTYRIHGGETIYDGRLFSSSSKGCNDLDAKEKEIVDEIYDNPKWFEDATFSEPKWKVGKKEITIYFEKPVDEDELLSIAKGIHATLVHGWKDKVTAMGWKENLELF